MEKGVRDILLQARRPQDLDTQVLAGVIGMALQSNRRPLIRGLSEARFQKLLNEFFIGLTLVNGQSEPAATADGFGDVVDLLLANRTEPTEPSAWFAYAIASAATRGNALWENVAAPSARHLSDFLRSRFAPLAARNRDDMEWSEFIRLCVQKTGQ